MNIKEIDEIRRTKLIALRESYGKSQKDFSEMIDMSASYYNRLESGGLRITDRTIQKISMALGIPWSNLMEEEKQDFSIQNGDEVKRNIYENNVYYQIDRLINRGGSSNRTHMQALLEILMGIESTLEYKEQIKDISENEDKIQEQLLSNIYDSFLNLE